MSITRYNKIYVLSLVISILYSALCLIGIIAKLPIIDDIISKTAIIYIVYSVGMLIYKIKLMRRHFLGSYAIVNMVYHGVFLALSALLVLIIMF